MRFTRIQASKFGPLVGIDSGETSVLPSLIAVVGRNEAGKSAFHHVLAALLYGFHPAKSESHPFAPWGGGRLEIAAEIQLSDQRKFRVQRWLMKTPHGRIVREEQIEQLGNRPLDAVRHIDRRVFREVYAITLGQLTGLREAAWEAVQEQLIGGMGSQDLRSPRVVIRGFHENARKLWQPTRRGKQQYRELQDRLAELTRARREAAARDRELRQLGAGLDEMRERLAELRAEREALVTRLETVRALLPFRQRLAKLGRLDSQVGDRDALADGPRDPIVRDQELTERLQLSERRRQELRSDLAELRSRTGSLSEDEEAILERGSYLRALSSRAVRLQEQETRQQLLKSEIAALERGIREASLPLLGLAPGASDSVQTPGEVESSASEPPFRALELSTLRERITAVEEARRRREDLEARLADSLTRTPGRTRAISVPGVLLAVASLGTLVAWLSRQEPFLLWLGLGLVVLASAMVTTAWSRWAVTRQLRNQGLEVQEEFRARIREAEVGERGATAAARELLSPLGLQAGHLDAPRAILVSQIGELKNLFRLRQERQVELARIVDNAASFDAEFERLLANLELSLPSDRDLALHELTRILEALEERGVQRKEALAEESRLEAALNQEREECARLVELRRDFDEWVARTGETVTPEGLGRLTRRLADMDLLRGLTGDLEQEAGSLKSLRDRIRAAEEAGVQWSDDPARLADQQARLDAIDHQVQGIREKAGELQEKERSLLKGDTPDLVDGQILDLRARLRQVELQRDRWVLLAHLLERAENRFRDEHQPHLLRRAGEHLGTITGHRYERVLIGRAGKEQGFFVDAEHLPEPTAVGEPLSAGTREQVYFALRLAIAEHLDRGMEPLPLLLDEVLVNWDPERRARVLDRLEGLAASRQIFVFTCHPPIAEEVTERGGIVLSLAPPDAA